MEGHDTIVAHLIEGKANVNAANKVRCCLVSILVSRTNEKHGKVRPLFPLHAPRT